MKIFYRDRRTQEIREEQVYYGKMLHFLYGSFFGRGLCLLITRFALFSYLFGWWQRRSFSRRKIAPFIKKFAVDPTEFALAIEEYPSFDAFFTRKLKKEARPLVQGEEVAIIPADGRYLVYPHVDSCDGFVVKGKKFSLTTLVQNRELARRYEKGGMVIARLCPTDYHRFHFPCSGIPGTPRLINGPLHSVSPIAIRKNLALLVENKRVLTEYETEAGQIVMIEIGATNVGSIHQTFTPGRSYAKGEEKGYFSFGGSSMILLFEPGQLIFDEDLVVNSQTHHETLCLFGQSLGRFIYKNSSSLSNK